jgi:hypothetical protein
MTREPIFGGGTAPVLKTRVAYRGKKRWGMYPACYAITKRYSTVSYCIYYEHSVRFVSYSILRLSRKDADIYAYCTVGHKPSL